MIACCSITYCCIVHFAPYIYLHNLSDIDEIVYELSMVFSDSSPQDFPFLIQDYSKFLSEYSDDEFVFHIFKSSGEELTLSNLNTITGKRIEDFAEIEKSKQYTVSLINGIEEYTLFATKNTKKESQIVVTLQKTLPMLSIIILFVSIIASFFYTWYMTKPINKISKLSKQMADMDFSGICSSGRTDEIGVLSDNLNTLSQKLKTTLSELQEANQKLQADIDMERRLEKQRVEFFAAASHELKTPITIIKGQLQGMLYQVGRYKDRETYLAQSLEITDTLGKMVQELLTISRLDAPGYICKKSNLNLGNLITDRITAFEDLFMQKDLTASQSISPEIYILGDMQLLQKALDNLLGNAAAYSGAGNQVLIKLWKETETTTLTIENTGAHIPDEAISKLFEPFYRVDQSRNRQTGGTGLGLYIVKTILDLHGAKIEIANTLQGVIVFVQF